MKQLGLILMLCFGFTSFAYAQEVTAVDAEVTTKDVRTKVNIKKIQDVKQKTLTDRKQVLEERAEIKENFKAQALETHTDLKAQFKAATTTEAREAIREEADIKREELKETAQEYKEAWRTKVKEYFRIRIEATFKKFANHIDKANQVDARIVSVVEKLQEAGVDTAEVEASLVTARVNTQATQDLMRTIRSDLETAVETGSQEEVRAAFNVAKADITEASQSLKAAYLDIRKAIADLKALIEAEKEEVQEADDVATTTTAI